MEAISFTTGLIGTAAACAEIYSISVNARRINKDGVLLVNKLAIEQFKFTIWLQDSGFGGNLEPTLKLGREAQSFLHRTLQTLRSYLEELGEIIEKYELTEGGTVNKLNFGLPDDFWKRHAKVGMLEAAKFSKRRRWFSTKSLSWALSDMSRSKELLGEVRRINEDLLWLSKNTRSTRFRQSPSRLLTQVLEEEALRQLIDASADQDENLSLCAALKMEVLQIAASTGNSSNKKHVAHLEKPERSIIALDIRKMRTTGLYRGENGTQQPILLESKIVGPNTVEFVRKRVEEIAQLLGSTRKPDELRVLNCLGYVPSTRHHGGSFNFILEYPAGYRMEEVPITLEDLLSKQHKPSLTHRFAMAATMSNSLLLLQSCGILHKAIHPGNILFFKPISSDDHDLTKPFLSGFDFARPHGTESEKIGGRIQPPSKYCHPDYSYRGEKERYLKVYDIYSLGLVLFEVAMWQDVDTILEESSDVWQSQIRERALGKVKTLESEVGGIYARVVSRCLTGGLDNMEEVTGIIRADSEEEDGPEKEAEFQEAFLKNIVEQLRSCNV